MFVKGGRPRRGSAPPTNKQTYWDPGLLVKRYWDYWDPRLFVKGYWDYWDPGLLVKRYWDYWDPGLFVKGGRPRRGSAPPHQQVMNSSPGTARCASLVP